MLNLIFLGLFFGVIIYCFTYIAAKKNDKFYLAPLVTFLVAVLIVLYSIFKIGGFEGMGLGIVGAGVFVVAILGVIILPFINKKNNKRLTKIDFSLLVILPIIFFATLSILLSMNEGYWIIDAGEVATNVSNPDSHYTVSTISEGAKQVHIQLGESYVGATIEIEKVKTIGNTEIIVNVKDGTASNNTVPYIIIGLDEIVEPFKVKTSTGLVIHSRVK